jgi:hypothetical protein
VNVRACQRAIGLTPKPIDLVSLTIHRKLGRVCFENSVPDACIGLRQPRCVRILTDRFFRLSTCHLDEYGRDARTLSPAEAQFVAGHVAAFASVALPLQRLAQRREERAPGGGRRRGSTVAIERRRADDFKAPMFATYELRQ